MVFTFNKVDWGTVAIGVFSIWMGYMSIVGQAEGWIVGSFIVLGVVLVLIALRNAGLSFGISPGSS